MLGGEQCFYPGNYFNSHDLLMLREVNEVAFPPTLQPLSLFNLQQSIVLTFNEENFKPIGKFYFPKTQQMNLLPL